ncbi:protein modifying enzyme [Lithospermum erythrorhizon]|uniref:procollagen-proline 4-dioxygenase n=1 Tax=Lithospermum erythrorhizon TaxID=34254 RepID=A0AAV3Q4E9_LITER
MAAKGRHGHGPPSMTVESFITLAFAVLTMVCFVIIVLLSFGVFSVSNGRYSHASSYRAHDLSNIAHNTIHRDGGDVDYDDDDDGRRGDQWVEVISFEPRASVYHNFLSKEECEHLINISKPHMFRSAVVASATGRVTDSEVRTSSGTFLGRGRDEIVRNIEKRIADFTFIPVENGEGLQVLHYEVGQKYDPHFDFFQDELNLRRGGQRIATIVMYLSDVEEGGETVFPAARGNFSSLPYWNELSACGKGGLSVKPNMGDALLFWNMKPDASVDTSSLHRGCPVIKGNKWSSTKWIRVNEHKV